MPRILYHAYDFSLAEYGPRLQGDKILRTSWARLIWSAITVGRASWNRVLQHGMYSAFEIVYRGSMLFANLEESPTRKLQRSAAYIGLDPTEKGAVSYFLGLTSAKLLSERLLKVPWLMHLDVYWDDINPTIQGESRPDLVGVNNFHEWFVFEAKGRTGFISSKDKVKAKDQTDRLIDIGGVSPKCGVGVISYFNSGDKLEIYIKDPPINSNPNGSSLNLDLTAFLFDYYRLFVDLIDSQYGDTERIEGYDKTNYVTKYIVEIDCHVGMNERLYEIYIISPRRATIYTNDP